MYNFSSIFYFLGGSGLPLKVKDKNLQWVHRLHLHMTIQTFQKQFAVWSNPTKPARFSSGFIILPQWHDTTLRSMHTDNVHMVKILLQCIVKPLLSSKAFFLSQCVIHSSLFPSQDWKPTYRWEDATKPVCFVLFFNMSTILDKFLFMYRHSNTAYGNETAHTTQLHSQSTHSIHEFQSGTLKMNIQ